jgi:DNA-binding MarR family transcriptional regulator
MTTAPTLTGQDINLAAFAARALLDDVLHNAGITFEGWVALRRLASEDGATTRGAFAAAIAALPGVPLPPVDVLLGELETLGLVHVDGDDVDVTAAGRARFEQVQEGGNRIAAELYGDLPAADLETTRRVLHEVTARATVMRSKG